MVMLSLKYSQLSNMNIGVIYFALLCFIKCASGKKYLSYVCRSFSSYDITRAYNPKCYYSGDVLGSFEDIARSHGYNTQVFEVITGDQYILKLFRISPMNSTSVGPPVLLVHGSLTSSTAYTVAGNRSLAFLLADEGYDVWVSNFRGTSYSDKHEFLNSHDKKFWDFTFHEYGIYDLKSFINLVSSTTKQKVIYIGWSIGARAYYVYNIMHPDEAIKKVRVSIALAPTVFMNLIRTPVKKFGEVIPYWLIKGALDIFFPEGVFYHRTSAIIKFALHFCFDLPSQTFLCEFGKDLITGFDLPQQSPETFPVLAAQSTEATGLKMLYHTVQLIKSKKFQQFDYGHVTNLMRYGTPNPPLYNFSLINLPIHIIYGANDFLSPEDNAELVYKQLPEVAKPFREPYRVKNDLFCHTDMVASKDIKPLLNDYIIEFLKINQDKFNN